jgi:hypothetical protein
MKSVRVGVQDNGGEAGSNQRKIVSIVEPDVRVSVSSSNQIGAMSAKRVVLVTM